MHLIMHTCFQAFNTASGLAHIHENPCYILAMQMQASPF